ncbi:MAG: hypothetical protein ACP5KE_04045 [Candidatus Methanodesulfokora sp.]
MPDKSISIKLLDPRVGFLCSEIKVEYRRNPFLPFYTRINIERSKRPKQVSLSDSHCPFCEIDRMAPKYQAEICREGRIKVGGAVVFPNLFPFGRYHSVIVMTDRHELSLAEFEQRHFYEGLKAALELYKRVKNGYIVLGMNYLQPAGASIVHPHMQISIEEEPPFLLLAEKERSFSYFSSSGSSIWSDYIKSEVKGPRFIGESDGFVWIASYAPLAENEVIGICRNEKSSLMSLSDSELKGISEGLTRVLRGFHSIGIKSFSMALHSWPEDSPDFSLHVHVASRPNPSGLYCSDRGFLELFFGEIAVGTSPEMLAEHMRSSW